MALYRLKDSPYWWVSIINPKTRQRIRCSTKLDNKKKAKEFEQRLFESLILGEQHFVIQKTQNITWRQAAERWLAETQHKKDHHNDVARIQWLEPIFGGKLLSEITSPIIQQAATAKAEQSSPSTANRLLAFIRSVLRRAHRQWGWLDKVPHVQMYKEASRRIRYLTKAEARRLLEQLPTHLQAMALFSLCTGLRASNVTGLRWEQIDLQRNHIWIHPDQAKAGKAIAVPLNATAKRVIIGEEGKHKTFVFTFEGKPVTSPNTKAWKKALARAGISNFRWHDLRHTWASWLIQAGTPLHALQELGGWSSYEMVRRYAHLSSEHLHVYSQRIETQDLLDLN